MTTIWLGLGSNIGDRVSHLQNALTSLADSVEQIARAPLYETAPQDYLDQGDFLNTVIRGQTRLTPVEMLESIRKIEREGGRSRIGIPAKGPRTIDIDILLWDNLIVKTFCEQGRELIIPHQSMHRRLFVLRPLLDLNPEIKDPKDGEPFRVKASRLVGQTVRVYRHEG